jgi:hypothetical protein
MSRTLALLCALLSAAIILAEATISPYLPNLSVFSRALHRTAGNELGTELLTFVSLVQLPWPALMFIDDDDDDDGGGGGGGMWRVQMVFCSMLSAGRLSG